MRFNRRTCCLLCVLAAAILACDGNSRGPVGPKVASLTIGVGASSARASGHVVLSDKTAQQVKDAKYSFTAAPAGSSALGKGELIEHHLNFDGHEVMSKAEVTCVSIVDNQAWVGTRLVRLVVDGEEQPVEGVFPIFRVVDVGEGQGTRDRASLIFFAAKGRRFESDMSYCEARPDFPILFENETGNVNVMP
jgi:hypothetical protein